MKWDLNKCIVNVIFVLINIWCVCVCVFHYYPSRLPFESASYCHFNVVTSCVYAVRCVFFHLIVIFFRFWIMHHTKWHKLKINCLSKTWKCVWARASYTRFIRCIHIHIFSSHIIWFQRCTDDFFIFGCFLWLLTFKRVPLINEQGKGKQK